MPLKRGNVIEGCASTASLVVGELVSLRQINECSAQGTLIKATTIKREEG